MEGEVEREQSQVAVMSGPQATRAGQVHKHAAAERR